MGPPKDMVRACWCGGTDRQPWRQGDARAGPLDHVTSVGFSKFAHVLRSEVVEGGKLEREGADCRDQEEGQVCGDGREWVYSGLGEQGGVHCTTAG